MRYATTRLAANGLATITRDIAFISYSHSDGAEWRDRLLIFLKPYCRQGRFVVWADPYIAVGTRWEREIANTLTRAKVGVILASPHFAASDFIAEVELPALREAADGGRLTLFCIPVSSVDPAALELGPYQWARSPNEALDLLSEPERNRALVQLTMRLVALFETDAPSEGSESEREESRPVQPLAKATKAGVLHGAPDLPPGFVARASALAELKDAVLESNRPSVGIGASSRAGLQGQGGIGKTVLALALVREPDVQRAFTDGIFWITLGQTPDVLGLQRELLQMATGSVVDLQSVNQGTLALREALSKLNCLLVLDDVWHLADSAAFSALGPPGRLLVTTRDQQVLSALGALTVNLDVFTPADAVSLLAEWTHQAPEVLPKEALEVAKECGYLPLALALAGAQANEGTAWAVILGALRDGDLEFLDHPHGSVFKSLAASVRALPEADAVRYLDLAVFPEDTLVPESVIVQLWTHAGLNEARAQKLIGTFASRSLLFLERDEANRAVRFHDLQHDYLRIVAENLPKTHARLLDAHLAKLDHSAIGPVRWASLPQSEGYLWKHLVYHLLGAGRADVIHALVTDVRWLSAKIAATGVASLLTDLAMVVEQAPSEENRRVERALRFESSWLYQYPAELPSLLYNRLRSAGATPSELVLSGLRLPVRLAHPVRFGRGRIFRGHSGKVISCAYSPDGSCLLSASDDMTLLEWDRSTGRPLMRFEGHSKWVVDCAYSPDGSRILSASWDGTLREWDRATGKELARFEGHASAVRSCAYSPDGARVLSASGDGTLLEWDRAAGSALMRFTGHTNAVAACAYSPDGSCILSASHDGTVREWERASGRELQCFNGHSGALFACVYSPDGSRVLSASSDETLREWDRATGRQLTRFAGHKMEVIDCAYSPDGSCILSASADGTLLEWDLVTGRELQCFAGHERKVTACAYSADGSRILSASDDQTLREWDRTTPELEHLEGHKGAVLACAYSPDGSCILSASADRTLREWDRATGWVLQHFEGHKRAIRACAYSADGSRVLSASLDRTVREWDRDTGDELRHFESHRFTEDTLYLMTAFSCTYSADGSRVLASSNKGSFCEWEMATGRELRCFKGHKGDVVACAYSGDGSHVLSASDDQTVREWNRTTGREVQRFKGHGGGVTACAYSADGSRVLSASGDGTLREWDRTTGREVQRFEGHAGGVTACAYSADGSRIFSASNDSTVKIWSRAGARCLHTILGAATFRCVAGTSGSLAAGDDLGNLWLFDCDEQ